MEGLNHVKMEENEQLFDKIEDYLAGKLSLEDAASFERQISSDPSLSELVEMHRFERRGIEYLIQEDLRQKLKDWEKSPPGEQGKKKGQNRMWFMVLCVLAAGILALLFIQENEKQAKSHTPRVLEDSSQWEGETIQEAPKKDIPIADSETKKQERSSPRQESENQPNNEYLALAFSSYNVPENLSGSLKSGQSSKVNTVLTPGLTSFAAGRFKQAIEEFAKVDPMQYPAEYKLAREYLGHAYFNNKEYEMAVGIFQSIAEESTLTALDRAEWYLLLSLLPNYDKHRQQADALIMKMLDPDSFHSYATKAEALKARLDKLSH